jgi:hypothetical protein
MKKEDYLRADPGMSHASTSLSGGHEIGLRRSNDSVILRPAASAG